MDGYKQWKLEAFHWQYDHHSKFTRVLYPHTCQNLQNHPGMLNAKEAKTKALHSFHRKSSSNTFSMCRLHFTLFMYLLVYHFTAVIAWKRSVSPCQDKTLNIKRDFNDFGNDGNLNQTDRRTNRQTYRHAFRAHRWSLDRLENPKRF